MKDNSKKSTFYFWAGHFIIFGKITGNTEHRHHAVQVIFNREGLFELQSEGSTLLCGGVIIGSDHPHQLLSSNDSQVHMLIDNETTVAGILKDKYLQGETVNVMDAELLQKLRDCIGFSGNVPGTCQDADQVYRKLTSELGASPGEKKGDFDPRIQDTINHINKSISKRITIPDLARRACLSESRLTHLFTEQIGIPISRYILWARLMTAVQHVLAGESITDAAYSAGFSDSAHLSRTYRQMYGITLASVFKNSRFIQVISCLD